MVKKIMVLSLIWIQACKPVEELKTSNYFDIKSVFKNQIKKFKLEKPSFTKQVIINGLEESKKLATINWGKELAPFVESDLNKAAFQGIYDIIKTDSTISYALKSGEKAPISSIFIKKSGNQISSIQINAKDKNILYHWEKNMLASFEKGILKKYSIEGKQKILIFDVENYKILATKN